MNGFGLILITHGGLAQGLLSSVAMIMGPQENIKTISLEPGKGLDDMVKAIETAINELGKVKQVFIISDLYGGTPFNSSRIFAEGKENVKVLTGVNLPMIIHFCSSSNTSFEQLSNELEEIGKHGVQIVTIESESPNSTEILD